MRRPFDETGQRAPSPTDVDQRSLLYFFLQFLACRFRRKNARSILGRDPRVLSTAHEPVPRISRDSVAREVRRKNAITTDRSRKRNEIKPGLKVKKERSDRDRSERTKVGVRSSRYRRTDGDRGGKRTRKDVKFRRSLADSPFGRRASLQSVKRMDALFRGRRRRPISRSNEFSGQWKDGNTDGKARCRPSSGLVIPRYEVKRGWLGDRAALGA